MRDIIGSNLSYAILIQSIIRQQIETIGVESWNTSYTEQSISIFEGCNPSIFVVFETMLMYKVFSLL